jgi:putative transposase
VAVVFPKEKSKSFEHYTGVDRNTRGHIAVVVDLESGKFGNWEKCVTMTLKIWKYTKETL